MDKFEELGRKIKRDHLMRILRNNDYTETLISQYIRYFESKESFLKAQTQIKEIRNIVPEMYDSIGFDKDTQ